MEIIKELYKYDRHLLGKGFDKALDYINKIIPLKIIEIPSGTKFETWTVPPEWIIKDAWVKFKGKKIIDYKDNPLCVMDYSQPIHGIVNLKELKQHLFVSDEKPEAIPYQYSFYEPNWGFSIPKNMALKEKKGFWKRLLDACEECKDYEGGKVKVKILGIHPKEKQPEYTDALPEGEYEVFIDSEFRPGKMKIGVHTIPGKSDKEILLFAHLDHPYQANDNLSGVACLIDLAKKIKAEYTIKLIFCPETIGSIGYLFTQDTSMVEFVIAVDCIGNNQSILLQKSFDKYARVNYAAHLALQEMGLSYRKGEFRFLIGSDEYVFNDPKIGIQGIMITRFPYWEYHTSADKPEIIDEGKIKEVEELILKIIDIYEKDYIPVRHFKAPLMRSSLKLETPFRLLNRDTDYLIFDIDGQKWLSEILLPLGLTFDYAYKFLNRLKENGLISNNAR